jgi:hypothetical protein
MVWRICFAADSAGDRSSRDSTVLDPPYVSGGVALVAESLNVT